MLKTLEKLEENFAKRKAVVTESIRLILNVISETDVEIKTLKDSVCVHNSRAGRKGFQRAGSEHLKKKGVFDGDSSDGEKKSKGAHIYAPDTFAPFGIEQPSDSAQVRLETPFGNRNKRSHSQRRKIRCKGNSPGEGQRPEEEVGVFDKRQATSPVVKSRNSASSENNSAEKQTVKSRSKRSRFSRCDSVTSDKTYHVGYEEEISDDDDDNDDDNETALPAAPRTPKCAPIVIADSMTPPLSELLDDILPGHRSMEVGHRHTQSILIGSQTPESPSSQLNQSPSGVFDVNPTDLASRSKAITPTASKGQGKKGRKTLFRSEGLCDRNNQTRVPKATGVEADCTGSVLSPSSVTETLSPASSKHFVGRRRPTFARGQQSKGRGGQQMSLLSYIHTRTDVLAPLPDMDSSPVKRHQSDDLDETCLDMSALDAYRAARGSELISLSSGLHSPVGRNVFGTAPSTSSSSKTVKTDGNSRTVPVAVSHTIAPNKSGIRTNSVEREASDFQEVQKAKLTRKVRRQKAAPTIATPTTESKEGRVAQRRESSISSSRQARSSTNSSGDSRQGSGLSGGIFAKPAFSKADSTNWKAPGGGPSERRVDPIRKVTLDADDSDDELLAGLDIDKLIDRRNTNTRINKGLSPAEKGGGTVIGPVGPAVSGGSRDRPRVVTTPAQRHHCETCNEIYKGRGLSSAELQKKIERNCCHNEPMATPDNFWSLNMPLNEYTLDE